MRLLCLLRHAKSSWDDPGLADFDRPLAPRGRKAAPRIGAWIAAQGLCPDFVLCSPALRTRQTWELVAPACGGSARVDHRRSIYEAPPQHLSAALAGVPASAERVLLIGHSPGLAEFAAALAGPGSDRVAVERLLRKFPTGALAAFECDVDGWDSPIRGRTRLTAFVRPKDLPADPRQSQ